MLKKAGIVVSVAAAGLLAVSPLAFANNGGDHEGGHKGGGLTGQLNSVSKSGGDNKQLGLVNVGDVNALNDVNVCPGVNVAAGVGNLLGILGGGFADTDADSGDVSCVNDDSITQLNNKD